VSSVEMPRKDVPPPLELVKSRIEEVLPPEAKDQAEAGELALIDTRPSEQFALGRIAGAVNVPAGENGVDSHTPEFARKVSDAAGGKPALLYCNSGNRSARATDALLNEHGEKGVRSLVGGIKLWGDLGFPVEGTVASEDDETSNDEDGEG
jgi:rhodanese-related sulfurtransferase